ncbi:MAG: hypothetical protein R3B71_05515 [Candidatus Gracilibacteria bacterium]
MTKLLKNLAFALLALLILVGTIFIENGAQPEAATALEMEVVALAGDQGATAVVAGSSGAFSGERALQPEDTIQTSNGQSAVIRFDSHGVLRLSSLTSVTFLNQTEDGYIFDLRQGSVWGNNSATSAGMNVVAGGSLLMPQRSSFDVSFNGESSLVRVFSGQVNVGLIDGGYIADEVLFSKSERLVNSFLVAAGSQATVSKTKVSDNVQILRQLLYSKLIKEFQYGLMNQTSLASDSWVTQNLAADRSLKTSIDTEEQANITSRGLRYGSLDSLSYDLDKSVLRLSETFTFSKEKRVERLVENIFEQLLDAKYLFVFGREAEGRERIVLFEQLLRAGVDEGQDIFSNKVMDRLWAEYAELNTVLPTDDLYDVKVALSDLLLERIDGDVESIFLKLGLIRDYINYAYALADTNQLEARLALQNYFTRFQNFIEKEVSGLATSSYLLAEENQIMDNLLRQYPQFYQDSYFAMKSFLEDEWLGFLPEGALKNEERQTIISTKIDFLKQLQTFFLNERVSLEDARLVAFRLINEIKDLQPGTDVGVSSLFALRLQDYGNFLRFLNATNVAQLRGSSPQDAYNDFIQLQQQQVSIEQVISEFLGEETVPTITPEDILAQIAEDFETIGATDLQVEEITDVNAQYIKIVNGVVDGVSFSGDYDWNRKLISNVMSGNVTLSRNAIRLSSLSLLFQPTETEEPGGSTETPTQVTPPETSQAERVAKALLLNKLKTNGVTALEENIVVRDLNAGSFVVNGARLADNEDVQMAFAFQNSTNVASSILVRTPDGDKQVADPYDISQLAAVARQVYAQGEEAAAANEDQNPPAS